MSIITITNDERPFSVFRYVRELITKTKDIAGGSTDVALNGFSKEQAAAICRLMGTVYANAIAAHPSPPDDLKAEGTFNTRGSVKTAKYDMGSLGILQASRDETKRQTMISWPNFDHETLPSFRMLSMLDGIQNDLLSNRRTAHIPGDPSAYRIFYFTDMPRFDIGYGLIDVIASAHGFTDPVNIVTVKEGLPGPDRRPQPSVLLREDAYQAIRHAERDIRPLPPHND